MPQGVHNGGQHQARQRSDWRSHSGRKKNGKKLVAKTGHVNKWAQFSKADRAQENLAVRREQDARIAAREAEERRLGYRPYR